MHQSAAGTATLQKTGSDVVRVMSPLHDALTFHGLMLCKGRESNGTGRQVGFADSGIRYQL